MQLLKRLAAVTTLAGAVALGVGALAPAPAQAAYPIDGMAGCYWLDWSDYAYVFQGMAGYCLGGGNGPQLWFDFNGNYGGYGYWS